MSLPVVVESEARANIVDAASWWAKHRDQDQAIRWYNGILAAIDTLSQHPRRCVLARENAKSDLELRELHFGLGSRPTHRIIFVIDSDAVRVLAVRHAAQDDWQPEE